MSRCAVHSILSLIILISSIVPGFAADNSQVNFKIYSPASSDSNSDNKTSSDSTETGKLEAKQDSPESMWTEDSSKQTPPEEKTDKETSKTEQAVNSESSANTDSSNNLKTDSSDNTSELTEKGKEKVLQGYIRVVPSGTKVPIILDSAIDSDTSQEGDEFAARTSEDLSIDGNTVVPAGSVIKGRIARLNAPKHLNRSGSVALKFDTVTTPDNRQIPLVATLVARGGVVHARRGLKDIAIDTGTFALPTVLGLGIGAIAGGASNSTSSVGTGGGALIGVGIGAAIGVIILCAKKGKRVDVRPGDELKIELAEDLRMPM